MRNTNWFKNLKIYWVQDVSFVTLLLMLVFTLFILPVLIEEDLSFIPLLNIMMLAIFLVGILSAYNYLLLIVAIVFFTISFFLRMYHFYEGYDGFPLLESIFTCLNLLVFIITNFMLLFRDRKFNFYRIIGAVNVYFIIALLGAFSFYIIELTLGNSLSGNIELKGDEKDFTQYIYFSLTSLTTVGFGDIYPVNQAAKMLSTFLAALGILYPAAVVAGLFSLISMRPEE
nr:hypothetical protein [Saprospiraceae bacterium]